MVKWKIHRFLVEPVPNGQRLDHYLSGQLPELSRSAIKKIIDLGGAHVDGRRVRNCSMSVRGGEQIEVYLDRLPLEPYRLAEQDVVFQDDYLIVLNKPAAVDTQPTHARYKGTLFEALQQHLLDPWRKHVKPSLGMVQRLDRDTTGLIVFSRHPRAHGKLTEAFQQHCVDKRYLALVSGRLQPAEGEIVSQLARSRKNNSVHSVSRGGKRAVTRYRTEEAWPQASLVEIELLTGRSHQIRAHMAEQGCPLLGDVRYGGPRQINGKVLQRPCLHAHRLAFKHPVSGEMLDFRQPIPEDMAELISMLRSPTDTGC